jgi:iron(III) transport system ATP-binding protein
LIGPEDIIHDDDSPYKAKVLRKNFRGANILYTLSLENNETVMALVSSHHNHSIEQEIGIKPQVDEIVLFETEKALLNTGQLQSTIAKKAIY